MSGHALVGNRYQLGQPIGQGATSYVHEAVDVRSGLKVALKGIRPAPHELDPYRARFRRETTLGHFLARGAARFVRALDWGEHGPDSLFLVSDLVEGGAVLDLSYGELKDRMELFARAALLVKQLHLLRLVHRDLRPDCFLVDAQGKLHLSGFSLAKLMDDAQREAFRAMGGGFAQPTGPANYWAPEQGDAARVDERSDVYSLGVILFEALSGRLPFPGSRDEVWQAQARVLRGEVAQPGPRDLAPAVPERLDAACRQAMHLDPAQRFPDVAALLEGMGAKKREASQRLEPVAPSPEPGAPASAPVAQPKRPSRRTSRLRTFDEASLPELAGPAAVSQPGTERDRGDEILKAMVRVLKEMGCKPHRKGTEVKFRYGERQATLAFRLQDSAARWGFFEHRVRADRRSLKGPPTGFINLLRAANAVNCAIRGARVVISADRLGIARPVLLAGRGPLLREQTEQNLKRLWATWDMFFDPLLEVKRGAPWSDALFLAPPPGGESVDGLAEALRGVDLELEQLDPGRLGLGRGAEQVVLSCHGAEVVATTTLRAWQPPAQEVQATTQGGRAPRIDALLEELQRLNQSSLFTLTWDPEVGVVGHAILAEGKQPDPSRLVAFLNAIDVERGQLELRSLQDGPSAKRISPRDSRGSGEPLAWLCSEAYPPFALREGMSVRLGRDHDVEFVLPHHAISRVHGEIRVSGGTIAFKDHSANGSLVNGARVSTTTLEVGDVLTLGPFDLELRGQGTGDDGVGLATEEIDVAAIVSGLLEERTLPGVLQSLEFNRRSGTLKVVSGAEQGMLVIRQGAPWFATLGDYLMDEEAVLGMLGLGSGRFVFTPNVAAGERTIDTPLTDMLMEFSRRADG